MLNSGSTSKELFISYVSLLVPILAFSLLLADRVQAIINAGSYGRRYEQTSSCMIGKRENVMAISENDADLAGLPDVV